MSDKPSKPSGESGQPPKGAAGEADKGTKQSLSSLLESWEQGEQPKGEKVSPDVAKRIERLEAKEAQDAYRTEMKNVVSSLKGDLDVDDFIVEAWANRQADSNAKLLKLWETRDENREAFDEAIKAMAPKFKEFWESTVPQPPEPTPKGPAAAVRRARESGSGSSGLEGIDFSTLSESEFALKKAEVFRAAKEGRLN